MRKPNLDQRERYGLDRQGNFRPELYVQYRRALRAARVGTREADEWRVRDGGAQKYLSI